MNEDLSSILEKLNISKDSISPEMIDNIMNVFNNTSSNNSKEENSSENSFDIDIETIVKLKSFLDRMKLDANNPRVKLLQDLKPYLNEIKQNRIEQSIKINKFIELLPLLSGDFDPHFCNDNQILFFSLMTLLF